MAQETPGVARTHDRPLDAYFDDMAPLRRLSAEEERTLAQELVGARRDLWTCLMKSGRGVVRRTLREVLGDKAPALRSTVDPTPEIVAADRDGEAARALGRWVLTHPECGVSGLELQAARARVRALRDRFVAANLALVVSVARRYERRLMSFSDLIQEGNTGLLKAVDRFDPERGYRFSTYAVWWIRHSIGRALSDRGREIRLPVHVAERQQTMLRARNRFEAGAGRAPTVEELADATGFSTRRVRKLLAAEFSQATARDDDTRGTRTMLVDEIPTPPPAYEDALDSDVLSVGLREAIAELPAMQQAIIRQRFGLDGGSPMTLREVGRLHALSRERIRQIQVSALAQIREAFEGRGLVA